ncbi:MAG: hypothetical protein ACRD1Z_08760 [Vicinamibacteria bacterium]
MKRTCLKCGGKSVVVCSGMRKIGTMSYEGCLKSICPSCSKTVPWRSANGFGDAKRPVCDDCYYKAAEKELST